MVVLLAGAVVLIWAFSPGERRRRSVMERLEIGDEVARAEQLLGPPTRCPATSLAHLRRSFPEGWPTASIDVALQRMASETRERWLYAIDPRDRVSCPFQEGVSEIGVGPDGRILWYIAIVGKTRLRLPEHYTPAGAEAPAP